MLVPLASGHAEGTGTLVLKTDTGDHIYTVEIAKSAGEKARGLMFRRTLPKDRGMIFLYDPPQVTSMWMRNTFISLDIVFITEQGTVLRIEANTEPFSTDIINSGGETAAVLELNAGEAAKVGLKLGDRVVFPGIGTEKAFETKNPGLW